MIVVNFGFEEGPVMIKYRYFDVVFPVPKDLEEDETQACDNK